MDNYPNEDIRYRGVFYLDGVSMSGEIDYNQKSGTIFLNVSGNTQGRGKPYGRLSQIRGQLDTGHPITLCNCICLHNDISGHSFQRLCFQAGLILFSDVDMSQNRYRKYTCEIENGLLWSGLSLIDSNDFENIRIKTKAEKRSFRWFGTQITFATALRTNIWDGPRSESCHVTERLEICIEADKDENIAFFLDVRNKVLALISFAIKDNTNVIRQFLYDYNKMVTTPIGAQEPDECELITNDPYCYLYGTPRHKYNFFLAQLPENVDLSKTLDKLVPVLNLYLSLFKYRDMPVEMVFLNVIQAVETFHARFYYGDQKSKYVQSVYDRFSNHFNFEYLKSLLLSDTQMDKNRKYIILVSRINDLLIGKYDGLFFDYYSKSGDFAQTIVDTRHYYTHYGESKEKKALKGNDLEEAVYILRLLLEYYVCSVLGIDINKKIRRELANHRTYKEIDRFYELNQHELQGTNPS